jgi:hypothetical protein
MRMPQPVARDLWALYVSLNAKLRPAPYTEQLAHAQEEAGLAASLHADLDGGRSRSRSRSRAAEAARARAEAEAAAERDEQRRAEREERRATKRRLREAEGRSPSPSDFDSDATTESGSQHSSLGTPARSSRSRAGSSASGMWTDTDPGLDSDVEGDNLGSAPDREHLRSRAYPSQQPSRKGTDADGTPLVSVTAVLYLALIMLRVPVVWEDLRV